MAKKQNKKAETDATQNVETVEAEETKETKGTKGTKEAEQVATVTAEEYEALQKQKEELQKNADNYKDMYQRLMAEFDNYKKRTIKEREANQLDAKISVLTKLLPVLDNIERAEASFEKDATVETLKQGVEMVFRQMKEVMDSEGVEYIEAKGVEFNPQVHNAVMHIEDETCDDNIIVEEFQKGYQCKGKVIRHSMVKVAN